MTATSTYLNRPIREVEQATFDRVIADNQDAGNWPASLDPRDEIERAEAIKKAAWAIMSSAEQTLTKLAIRLEDNRSVIHADQADWPVTIAEVFEDLDGNTFGCLTRKIDEAKAEAMQREG